MNKQGKTSPAIIIGVITLIAIAGLIAYGVTQTQLGPKIRPEPSTSPTACGVDTNIQLAVINAFSKGSSVSPTINAKINGGATQVITSSTNLNPGDNVEILLNASDYLDTILPKMTLECGQNSKTAEMYATDGITFRIFNSNNNLLTDSASGGATNQSSSSSPINLQVYLDSKVDQSSGNLVVVIESTNTTEVDSITLSGSGVESIDVPEFYTVAGAGSVAKAFSVPAIMDGVSKDFTLTLNPETGQTIGSGENVIYVTAYSEQAYIDTDGTYKTGIENADGTATYEDTFDFDFMIV